MESKIKIKMGPIEIEYEGSEAFLKEELPALLSAVSDLYKESGVTEAVVNAEPDPAVSVASTTEKTTGSLQATTGTIAARLGVKSGPELALAAAARLTLSLGIESFSRAQLLEEMKSASAYFKQTYNKNLSGTLTRLLKDGKLFETAKNTYSLSASQRSSMEARLAQ
ncbi:hypothetical protein CGH72_23070 [Vibrio parahaemolyticus]|uniref:hypothetical protein n=2 Tax=Vibrio parahaemolyticus TaxID=670 RepID=UPI000414B8B9|nr:hypothetical protein [Vibrio parahaemolyticus]EGQ8107541.1 hypothetical protein [Vibrio parahaemolyticus]EKA7417462.1 hypothetical protein [Vibrio parahaemolyticus]ELA9330789.1 hypothetical protein [Vibrio parahaemolyticus]TOM41465.1 hypothetical protein CGH79_20995 [Vibrio parahaemolyticus]TOM65999.1 hypothetical protein CGH72_23070 [Vibrio parahaemolyticus]